jgi:large subunit ribosomal protein L15
MQLHQLKRTHANKKHVQVGRGGTRGKTSGRGTKGQNARAGHKKYPELRVIIKRLPKLRGYRFNSRHDKAVVANVGKLGAAFVANDKVTPATLRAAGVVSYKNGVKPVVKILGTGEITIPLLVSGCKVSKQAQDKIVKAGGAVN